MARSSRDWKASTATPVRGGREGSSLNPISSADRQCRPQPAPGRSAPQPPRGKAGYGKPGDRRRTVRPALRAVCRAGLSHHRPFPEDTEPGHRYVGSGTWRCRAPREFRPAIPPGDPGGPSAPARVEPRTIDARPASHAPLHSHRRFVVPLGNIPAFTGSRPSVRNACLRFVAAASHIRPNAAIRLLRPGLQTSGRASGSCADSAESPPSARVERRTGGCRCVREQARRERPADSEWIAIDRVSLARETGAADECSGSGRALERFVARHEPPLRAPHR